MACGDVISFILIHFYTFIVQKSSVKLSSIVYESLRYRGKYNSRRPRPRHEILRYLEEITKPVIIKQLPDQTTKCAIHHDRMKNKLKTNTDSVCFNL